MLRSPSLRVRGRLPGVPCMGEDRADWRVPMERGFPSGTTRRCPCESYFQPEPPDSSLSLVFFKYTDVTFSSLLVLSGKIFYNMGNGRSRNGRRYS